MGFPGSSVVKNLHANAGDKGTWEVGGSVPGSGRSPGGGNGNVLQFRAEEPGESHRQRSLVGCSPWGHRVRHD